jgi:hypothetical protein
LILEPGAASSFVAFGATFPKGEGFWCGGNFQISA